MIDAVEVNDRAIAKILDQFSILIEAGGRKVAGERSSQSLLVPFTAQQAKSLAVMANVAYLPYEGDTRAVVQHAVNNWLYALSSVLAGKDERFGDMQADFEWVQEIDREVKEADQYQKFLQMLRIKSEEVDLVGDPCTTVEYLIKMAGRPRSEKLRAKLFTAIANDPVIRRAINHLPHKHPKREGLVDWLEAHG